MPQSVSHRTHAFIKVKKKNANRKKKNEVFYSSTCSKCHPYTHESAHRTQQS